MNQAFTRRRALAGTLSAFLPLAAGAQQDWPNRPIRLIVPYPPGGGTDVMARVIATRLSARLGQQIIIDNKGGAGGVIGTSDAAKSPPDGYTLLFSTSANATLAATQANSPFSFEKDFVPIGQIGTTPPVFVVPADSKLKTMRDLIELARSKPNAVSYGSAGVGSYSHLAVELLATEAKIQLLHVPYKGTGPAFADLLGGSLDVLLPSYASASPFLQGGKVRGIGITSANRSPLAPDMPAMAEIGLPGAASELWWGLVGRAGLPPDIVRRLNTELNAVIVQPEMQALLAREVALPAPGTPEAFGKMLVEDIARWRKLVKEKNIKTE